MKAIDWMVDDNVAHDPRPFCLVWSTTGPLYYDDLFFRFYGGNLILPGTGRYQ